MTEDNIKNGVAKQQPQSKVNRLIHENELTGLGSELEDFWTSEGDNRKSLRELAEYFNKQLLRSTASEHGVQTIDGEIENIYRLLTDDSVSSGRREEVRSRLEQNGINVEQLESDFISYQAVRSYLRKHRNAEYEGPDEKERSINAKETIQQLSSRTQTVTEERLKNLRGSSVITIGEFQVFVDVNILCSDCNTQYTVTELIEQGGCDCMEN